MGVIRFDFEKLLKNLRIENGLILAGILSLLISLYNEYIFGIKVSFLFLSFGILFRFYNISIVRGLFFNYMDKFRYKRKNLVYDKNKATYNESEQYVIPFEKSWYINLIDFLLCLIILLALVYIFVCLVQ